MEIQRALTIAIAGGSGFAGKALAVELLNRGHRVRILARSVANGNPQPNLETRQCDVFSLKQVDEALAGCDRSVRSVQRLNVPRGRDADWIARRYGIWLGRFFRGLITVTMRQRNLVFAANGIELLQLDYSAERSDRTRALYYITGGALARKHTSLSGRLEFRLLASGSQALAAIHDFEPALLWPIYANSQAPFHAWVMGRFRGYLAGLV